MPPTINSFLRLFCQTIGWVVYSRNLYLIRRGTRQADRAPAGDP